VDDIWKKIVWGQLGAAIDMLENAIAACPADLWNDRSRQPEFWYVAYHTLFWLDLYPSESLEEFIPPAPFTLSELDPASPLPPRPYTKDEMMSYLAHGRKKCRNALNATSAENAKKRCPFEWVDVSGAELFLYNMRHVQHHAGQLNLILRQTTDSAPGWIVKAGEASK
jgi:hypothetical protein